MLEFEAKFCDELPDVTLLTAAADMDVEEVRGVWSSAHAGLAAKQHKTI